MAGVARRGSVPARDRSRAELVRSLRLGARCAAGPRTRVGAERGGAEMTARPEAAALEPLLEQLGLRQAAAVLPDWLDRAASQELSYADFLHGLLEEESVAPPNAPPQQPLRQPGLPYTPTIEQFDF